MTLKQHIAACQKLIEENPDCANMEINVEDRNIADLNRGMDLFQYAPIDMALKREKYNADFNRVTETYETIANRVTLTITIKR